MPRPKTRDMKRYQNLTLLLLLFITVVPSCKKDGKEIMRDVTIQNVAGTYVLVSIQSKSLDIPLHDKTNELIDACEKDDEYILDTDMNFIYKETGMKCEEPGNHGSYWKLQGTYIKFDQFEGDITHLTNKQLVITLTFSIGGITYTEMYTFSRR
jgi:hypothetical protein